MATQFSQMTQSERSKYRLNVTRRRLGKSVAWPGAEFGRSCAPSQPVLQPARVRIIAVDECASTEVLDRKLSEMSRKELAALNDRNMHACPNPSHLAMAIDGIDATEDRAHERAMAEADPMFVVQTSPDGKGNWTRLGKLRSDTARKLAEAAGEHAKSHPGVCVRVIRPTEGARAVLRYRYVQDKLTGAWFLGSYR